MVWQPLDEYICGEIGDEAVLMKNDSGRVGGFEKLSFLMTTPEPMRVTSEAVAV